MTAPSPRRQNFRGSMWQPRFPPQTKKLSPTFQSVFMSAISKPVAALGEGVG
jgi:hypothetical protein